jgi:hypothetical protein
MGRMPNASSTRSVDAGVAQLGDGIEPVGLGHHHPVESDGLEVTQVRDRLPEVAGVADGHADLHLLSCTGTFDSPTIMNNLI